MKPESTVLFNRLDAGGRFHRDSALGRVFHPGTLSFREVSSTDSVHLAVSSDNHVSVHVDRLSPLVMRPEGRSRYSLPRAVAHTAVAAWEYVGRVVQGEHGHQACHLACEIVWVPDEEDAVADAAAVADADVQAAAAPEADPA